MDWEKGFNNKRKDRRERSCQNTTSFFINKKLIYTKFIKKHKGV